MTKGRESGMPAEDCWNSFFDAPCVIRKLFGPKGCHGSVVEFGCGYGTFTFPAAMHATETVHAFDIEPDLIAKLQTTAKRRAIANIIAKVRDFVADGTGLAPASQSHAMIYNLLHIENANRLIEEAHRVVQSNGRLSVIHWRSDIPTPRGPSLNIRPTPEQCKALMKASGFCNIRDVVVEPCCRYHFALVATR